MINSLIKGLKNTKLYFWDRLSVLRAGILGANDGIISISGIVLGATGANLDSRSLLITGISGMLAGACSMAGGEWISVSTQRDLQVETMTSQASLKTKTIDAPQLHKKDLLMPLHAAGTSCLMGLALCLNAVFSTLGNHISIGKTIIRNVLIGFLTIIITYILGSVLSI